MEVPKGLDGNFQYFPQGTATTWCVSTTGSWLIEYPIFSHLLIIKNPINNHISSRIIEMSQIGLRKMIQQKSYEIQEMKPIFREIFCHP